MKRRNWVALLFGLVLVFTAVPAAAMMGSGGGGLMCDWYLNIHRSADGSIINWWYSVENCSPVGGGDGGGSGGPQPGDTGIGAFEGCDGTCGNPCENTNCPAQ